LKLGLFILGSDVKSTDSDEASAARSVHFSTTRDAPTTHKHASGGAQAQGLEGQLREGFKLYLISVAEKKNSSSSKRSMQKFFLLLISWYSKREAGK